MGTPWFPAGVPQGSFEVVVNNPLIVQLNSFAKPVETVVGMRENVGVNLVGKRMKKKRRKKG